ncbi:MAG: DNA polymerase III subunit beta [Bacilli bacterium]
MKMKIDQNILIEHLNYVIKGISNKNLIPILNCIKLELTNKGLYLTSTNNDISIRTFIDNKDINESINCGNIVVSGRYIYDIIRKLPNEVIIIEEIFDSSISISSSNSTFKLNCNRVEEYPNIDLEENKQPINITTKILKNLIHQTVFATSTQESRPILTGLNLKIFDDCLECTATDSYRLSKKKIKLDDKYYESINVIIPSKNIIELNKLLFDEKEKVELHIFNNKIIFKFKNIIFMSRLINGTYPDTYKLIPQSFKINLKVKLNSFYQAIDRASLLTNESDKNTIKLETNQNLLTISSNIPEIGNVVEEVNIENINKKDIKISFSSKYMLECLRYLSCEEIEILLNGEVQPIIIKNINDDGLIQLILPIRTY